MSTAESSRPDTGGNVSLSSLHTGAGLYGIETAQLREVLGAITPQRVPLAPEFIAGIVPYRGEVLTTVSFRVLLGLERSIGPDPVLVLDDGETGEPFGLVVDRVGGVVSIARNALEPKPCTLDATSLALFAGVCQTPSGLMVLLAAERLRPERLAASAPFCATTHNRGGSR